MTDIMNIFKQAAVNAVNALKLVDLVYGTVISVSPLKVQVDQKLILEDEQLKLTRAVMDYEVDLTRGVLISAPDEWEYPEENKWRYMIHNGLVFGDRVTMIRAHGGQQYLIIDKEWPL